LQSNL